MNKSCSATISARYPGVIGLVLGNVYLSELKKLTPRKSGLTLKAI